MRTLTHSALASQPVDEAPFGRANEVSRNMRTLAVKPAIEPVCAPLRKQVAKPARRARSPLSRKQVRRTLSRPSAARLPDRRTSASACRG
jgi:hypothetical protein